VLVRQLLGEAIGTLIEALATWRLEVALLPLVLCLLVGVHEVASASIVAIALLGAPNLLLAGLVGVYRLRECRGRRWECSAGFLLVLVVSVTATEAKVELQAVALLVVVHRGRRNRFGGEVGVVLGVGRWMSIAEGTASLGGGDR
jgi:Ca2+/H+ antiporter